MARTFDATEKQELIEKAAKRMQEFYQTQDWWREHEVCDGDAMYDGSNQWTTDEFNRYTQDGITPRTINRTSPVVDAVAGFEAQNPSTVQYSPRVVSAPPSGAQIQGEQEAQADIVESTVKYIFYDTQAGFENSQAFMDMLKCGVGATETTVAYDENPDGETEVESVDPWLLGWDVAACRKNLRDANYCWRAKVVDEDVLKQEIEDSDDSYDAGEVPNRSHNDQYILRRYDPIIKDRRLSVIWSYQWREKEAFYRVANTITAFAQNPVVAAYLRDTFPEYGAAPDDAIIVLDKQQYKKLSREWNAMGVPVKGVKQFRWRYYRARFAGCHVLDVEENFSQRGYSLKFMTGKYDRNKKCWYGVVRAAKEPQRLYNRAISDLQGYLDTIPIGGVNIEVGAVAKGQMQAFVDTYRKAKDVTIFEDGALSQGKVQPKTAAALPQGVPEMILAMADSIMAVMGVSPDFMALRDDSADQSGILYARRVRQGLMVLAIYFQAKKFYMQDQGALLIDCVRVMAENAPNRLIRNVTGKGDNNYLRLIPDDIAAEYDIIVTEVAQTPDEKHARRSQLIDLTQMLLQAQSPAALAVLNMVVKDTELPVEDQKKVQQMLVPPPPPPPDPVQQGLLVAQTNDLNAGAELKSAGAKEKNMNILKTMQELDINPEQVRADLDETRSKVELNLAKADDAKRPDPAPKPRA